MAGRPTELTDDVIRKIEEVAALDGSVEEMAFYANVHRATIYRWLKENVEFSDRIDALRQKPFLKARQTIVKNLDNPQHAFEYMKRKKKGEFSERTEMTGADGKDLIPIPIIKLEKDVQPDNGDGQNNSADKED